jgi:hypothetical protein
MYGQSSSVSTYVMFIFAPYLCATIGNSKDIELRQQLQSDLLPADRLPFMGSMTRDMVVFMEEVMQQNEYVVVMT